MGAQRLSDRKTRRIARITGLDVIRAWSHGGYDMAFVTRDHRHGWFDLKTEIWQVLDEECVSHYTTCGQIDPTQPSGYREGSDGPAQ